MNNPVPDSFGSGPVSSKRLRRWLQKLWNLTLQPVDTRVVAVEAVSHSRLHTLESATDHDFGTEKSSSKFLSQDGTFRSVSSTGPSLQQIYPVGHLMIETTGTNPGTWITGTTWVAVGSGKVLVGLDSGDADFNTEGKTGGSKTVASSAQTFAGDALGTHQHDAISAGTPAGTVAWPAGVPTQAKNTYSSAKMSANASGTACLTAETTPGAISWPAGVPTFNGTALGTHQHAAITAGTPSGTNTPGAATSVVQPYLVVYMWKRTV